MKVAIIVCTFPPYKGGMGNAAKNEARELVKLGCEVTVLTPKYEQKQGKDEVMPGIKVKRLTPVFKYGNGAFLPQLFWMLSQFDLVYLHYPFFGGAEIIWLRQLLLRVYKCLYEYMQIFLRIIFKKDFAWRRRQRFVIRYHMDVEGKGLLGLIFKIHTKILMPWIINSACKVVVSSFDYAENSEARKLIDERWAEIPFGADLKRFDSNYLKLGSNSSNEFKKDDGKMVLFVGALDKAHYFKGVDVLIDAVSKLKHSNYDANQFELNSNFDANFKVVIVGGGDMKNEYEKIVKEKGLADVVKFTGKVSDEELVGYYRQATVLVLPSVDKSEAFGIVLIEAMASGVPVIASDLPGVRSVVDEGKTGFLVKPGDTGALAEKIEYVLSYPDEARKMGLEGRRRVEEKYDWRVIGKELQRVMEASNYLK